jgi:L-alanine-DL-glutamate epimerase-like enolase superfamily enzyme
MKITALRTQVVHMPLAKPIRAAIFEIRSIDCVLTWLDTDQGLTGEGLALAMNRQRVPVLHEMVRSFEPLLLGLDPTMAGSFHQRAWKELNFLGHSGVSIIGLAAVDNALWDLRGKAAGLNVSRLLGAVATSLPVYASGGLWLSASIDELQAEADSFRAKGFRAMKARIGNTDHGGDLARIRALRQAIGPDIKLMVDANQQMTRPQALRMGRALEEFDLTWFEEPLPYWDHEGEAALAAALDTRLASGETVHTSRGMHEMLKLNAADVLMPDLQRMGGPTEFLKAARLAEAHDIPVSSHLYSEMSLSLLAALPNAIYLEHMPWLAPLYREQIELDADGRAIVPDRPGWGFTFDPDAVRRFAA